MPGFSVSCIAASRASSRSWNSQLACRSGCISALEALRMKCVSLTAFREDATSGLPLAAGAAAPAGGARSPGSIRVISVIGSNSGAGA